MCCAHLLNPLNALPAQLGRHSHLHCTRFSHIRFSPLFPFSLPLLSLLLLLLLFLWFLLLLTCVAHYILLGISFMCQPCALPSSRPMSAAVELPLLLLLLPSLHRKRHPNRCLGQKASALFVLFAFFPQLLVVVVALVVSFFLAVTLVLIALAVPARLGSGSATRTAMIMLQTCRINRAGPREAVCLCVWQVWHGCIYINVLCALNVCVCG